MKISKEFVLREISGEYIFVPVGKTALEFNGLVTVNGIGVFIWELLQKGCTFDEIIQHILNEYEIDEETARNDVCEFINYLKVKHILDEE